MSIRHRSHTLGAQTLALAVALAPVATSGRALQQESTTLSPSASRPTFRASVELVVLSVTVLDGRKRFILDLGPEDFGVYENGVLQELVFFGVAEIPVDLALMIDLSSSM